MLPKSGRLSQYGKWMSFAVVANFACFGILASKKKSPYLSAMTAYLFFRTGYRMLLNGMIPQPSLGANLGLFRC